MFDTVVQLALNGICCKRDDIGRLTDPCESCYEMEYIKEDKIWVETNILKVNVRCGCIGDFTDIEIDQSSDQ